MKKSAKLLIVILLSLVFACVTVLYATEGAAHIPSHRDHGFLANWWPLLILIAVIVPIVVRKIYNDTRPIMTIRAEIGYKYTRRSWRGWPLRPRWAAHVELDYMLTFVDMDNGKRMKKVMGDSTQAKYDDILIGDKATLMVQGRYIVSYNLLARRSTSVR